MDFWVAPENDYAERRVASRGSRGVRICETYHQSWPGLTRPSISIDEAKCGWTLGSSPRVTEREREGDGKERRKVTSREQEGDRKREPEEDGKKTAEGKQKQDWREKTLAGE